MQESLGDIYILLYATAPLDIVTWILKCLVVWKNSCRYNNILNINNSQVVVLLFGTMFWAAIFYFLN